MQFSILALLASAGFAAAQTSTACAAQNIVDTCLGTTGAQVSACGSNDWTCLCAAQQAVLTCYNNCPGDPNRVAASNQEISWCNARDVVSSQSAAQAALTATTSSGSSTRPTSASVTLTTTASTTSTNTASSSTATAKSTGAANAMIVPAGGLLAVAGVFAGLL